MLIVSVEACPSQHEVDDISHFQLARTEHVFQSAVLCLGHTEVPSALDLDPAGSISAVKAGQRRSPLVRALITLLLVDIVGHGP